MMSNYLTLTNIVFLLNLIHRRAEDTDLCRMLFNLEEKTPCCRRKKEREEKRAKRKTFDLFRRRTINEYLKTRKRELSAAGQIVESMYSDRH